MVQLGSVISNTIYQEDDKPLYRKGNSWLIVANVLAIAIFLLTKLYYVLVNKNRDQRWRRMTEEVGRLYCMKDHSLILCRSVRITLEIQPTKVQRDLTFVLHIRWRSSFPS